MRTPSIAIPAWHNTPSRNIKHRLMLIRLIYASRTKNLGPMDVKDILQRSQRNNQKLGVTGALCLSNGIFCNVWKATALS